MPRHLRAQSRLPEAQRISELRSFLGLSQREMAERLGVTPGAFAMWETGTRTVPGPAMRILDLYEHEIRPSNRASPSIEADVRDALVRRSLGIVSQTKHLSSRVRRDGRAKPIPPPQVADLFVEDFGHTPRQIFREWSSSAFFLGSVAQVHQARLASGEVVAVKVQRPEVSEELACELEQMQPLFAILERLFDQLDVNTLAATWKAQNLRECDYLEEARAWERLRELSHGDPRLRIARTYPEMTTRRILTMEYLDGEPLVDFTRRASPEQRRWMAEVLDHFTSRSRSVNHHIHSTDILVLRDQVRVMDLGRPGGSQGKSGA